MIEPQTRKVRGEGIGLEVGIWEGDRKKPPVLCVHGLTANHRCWMRLAAAIAPGRRVIALDLRGRGLSDQPQTGYSIDRHCADLSALIADLGLGEAAIMGHSLGAAIALNFAASLPGRVERLILVDGAGKLTPKQTAKVFAGIKPSLDRLGQSFPSPEAYLEKMKEAPFLKPWTTWHEAYFRYELMPVPGGFRSRTRLANIQEEVLNLARFNAAPLYKSVRCPTLILRAPEGMIQKDDVLLPKAAAAKMVASIKQAWLVEIKGSNHYSILFDPNPTRDRAIACFLES